MKKLLLKVLFLPMITFAYPTSGWQDSDGGGLLAVIATLAIFIVPVLISKIVSIFKTNKKESETVNPIQKEISLNDAAVEPKEKDIYVDTYKTHAKEFIKEPYVREDNNTQMNTGSREPFYIVIIFVLLIIMFVQYTKYREDSFSRITQCFADVVPDSEKDFCESFYEKYRDPKITLSEAEKVITDCWDERFLYCEEEGLGDECTFEAYNYCAVKNPDHWEILEAKY